MKRFFYTFLFLIFFIPTHTQQPPASIINTRQLRAINFYIPSQEKTIRLFVTNQDTVRQIKQTLRQLTNIPEAWQVINNGRQTLADSISFSSITNTTLKIVQKQ